MKDRNCSSLMRCASSLQRLFFLALLSIIAIGAYAQGKARQCRELYSTKVGNL